MIWWVAYLMEIQDNEVLQNLATLICIFSLFALILIHKMERKLIRISMRIDKNKIKLQCSLSFMYLTCYVVVKLTGNSRVGQGSGREHLLKFLVSLFSYFFLHFSTQKSHHKQQHSSKTIICFNTSSYLCLNWPTFGIRLLFIFSWSMVPSCIYLFTHLLITVGLQCFLLLLPQLTQVHTIHNQLSSPSHHFRHPPCVSK